MKVNLFDTEKFIEVNNLKEVTNPIHFDRGYVPSPDGLFSYEIFGRPGTPDRKNMWAYISLKGNYFHPLVFKQIRRLNRNFDECVNGFGSFTITDRGELVKDESDNGQTGIEFLYKNWNKLKFTKTESIDRGARVDLLGSLKKDEIFMSNHLVIPAFYRDVNFTKSDSGLLAVDEINDYYAKLIRLVNAQDESLLSGFDFTLNNTKSKIQALLVEIYNYFTKFIKGKNGIFHKFVMGKSVDYGVRTVISSPQFKANSYAEMQVSMDYIGIPLSQICVLFFPFMIKTLQDTFFREFGSIRTMSWRNPKNGQIEKINIAEDAMDDFTYDIIKKKIDNFTKSPSERFEVVHIKTVEKGKVPLYHLGHLHGKDDKTLDSSLGYRRPMTWTDLLYKTAVDVVVDKHVYITRYPLEDYFGIYPSKVAVLSTIETSKQTVGGRVFTHYPVINVDTPQENVPNLFVDSLQIFNPMVVALGGDFDGDQVTVRGVFTQEANKEAERLMYSPKNISDITGSNVRKVTNEGLQTLYQLTKE